MGINIPDLNIVYENNIRQAKAKGHSSALAMLFYSKQRCLI